MKILLASSNTHKKREILALLDGLGIEILTLKDLGYTQEIPEDGDTFLENSAIKAHWAYRATGLPTLADDSGISIRAMGYEPGIRSARFLSPEAGSGEKNREILRRLEGEQERQAHYTCALTFLDKDRSFITEQYCHGLISQGESGVEGFGYDPIFLLPELGKTMAALDPEEKNRLSHRGKALAAFREYLETTYGIV